MNLGLNKLFFNRVWNKIEKKKEYRLEHRET